MASKGQPFFSKTSGYAKWLQLGTMQMAGWAKYRYGDDTSKWPITLYPDRDYMDRAEAASGKSWQELNKSKKAKMRLVPSEQPNIGVQGLLFALLMDAAEDMKFGTRDDKARVLSWVHGERAKVPFSTVCTLLDLNQPFLVKQFTSMAKEQA